MRAVLGLAFCVSGCLIPERSLNCPDSELCEPPHVRSPFVLGQPDGETSWLSAGLREPSGVTVLGEMLMVADTGNDRILIWKTWPTRNRQPPDLVVGQKQLTVVEAGPLSNSLRRPRCLTGDSSQLIVGTDLPQFSTAESNRLLAFSPLPSQNYPSRSWSLDVGTPGAAGPRNFSMPSPLLAGGSLFVADRGYNRVLYWRPVPASLNVDATGAMGQPNLTTGTQVLATNSSFGGPDGCPGSDGTRLYVADTKNNRVLIWNNLSSVSGSASLVLGQADFTSQASNRGSGSANLGTLFIPVSVAAATIAGTTRIAVVDQNNHRVLLWDSFPAANGGLATRALGQPDGVSNSGNAGGISASTLAKPSAVWTDGTRIAVADKDNHRVLLWNQWPTVFGKAADVILGQSEGDTNRELGSRPGANSFMRPYSVARVGEGMAVVEQYGSRVLLWPTLPLSASDAPTVVVGQPDLNSGQPLYPGGGSASFTAQNLYSPEAVASDGQLLVVNDGFVAGRVMVWKSVPTQSLQPADVVLGMPMFSSFISPGDPTTDLDGPAGVAVYGGRIYIADTYHHRVLIWRAPPTQNNQRADVVLGQASFMALSANRNGTPAANTLNVPRGLFVDEGHLYVADSGNHRILIWNTNDPVTDQPADVVVGQTSATEVVPCGGTGGGPPFRLCNPAFVNVDANHLFVVEEQLNRVLSWPQIAPPPELIPDHVFGQPDLSTTSANLGRLAIDRLQGPRAVLATERGIYIADTQNGRVVALPPLPRSAQ